MYRNKHQIDKHVAGILGTIRDEKERHSKGFQIAKMYLEIKEYDTAKKYLDGFLIQRDNFAPAHRLMGQILEAQGLAEKAISSYKRCLQLDEKQKDVLVKVCELYCQLDVDPEKAQYWAERIEKIYPDHQVSFKLRELAIQNMKGDLRGNSHELECLIASELNKRPRDAKLRAKMIRLFLDTERVNEAYTHVLEMEQRVIFTQSQEWNQAVLDVLQEYKNESGKKINGTYHQTLLNSLNNMTSICMKDSKPAHVIEALHQFDQTLYGVSQQQDLRGDIWNVFHREMQAQFFFHVATLLLKKAQQDRLQWKEAVDLASACYLCSSTFKPPSKTASWYATASEDQRPLLDYWYQIACHRCSQTGHMINRLAGFSGGQWMEKIQEEYCTDQGKDKLFNVIFTQPRMKDSHRTSFLINNAMFTIIAPELPRKQQLKEYDTVSHSLYPNNLHNMVWIAMQYYNIREKTQPSYEVSSVFDTLQHGVLSLETAVPETVCQLDVEAFLYAVVYVSSDKLADEQRNSLSEPGQPSLLPPALCGPLATDEQTEWWETVYKLYNNITKEQLGKLRLILQRGLETIRVIGNHGMDISLVTHLARTFEQRTEEAKAQSSNVLDFANEIASLQARAQAYWKAVVELADSQLKGTLGRPPKKRLFDLQESRDEEIILFLNEGRYFLACIAMAEGRNEESLKAFDNVNTAESAYFQGQLYKRLASEELGAQTLDQTGGDQRNKQIALLIKSRDKFYLTLDRLRGDKAHPLNADLADEIDEVESKLARLENDCVPRDISIHEDEELSCLPMETNGRSFRKPQFVASTPRRNLSVDISRIGQNKTTSSAHLHSTTSAALPRTRPSPERLEAQMRQFTHTQDNVVMTLLEELKERRKITQQTQEKILSLEGEKGNLQQDVSQLKHSLNIAERERDSALQRVEFMKEEKIRIDDERQRLNTKEAAAEEARSKAEEKIRQTEREQNRLEYESKRLQDEKDRLKEQQDKLAREVKELDDKRKKFEQEKIRFEEEKKVELEKEKERRKKEDEERLAKEQALRQVQQAQQQAQQQQQQQRPDLYNPNYRAYQPGYDLFAAAQYGYTGQQYQHPLMAGLQQGYRYPHAAMAGHGQAQTRGHGQVRDYGHGFQEDEFFYDDDEDEENGQETNGSSVVPPQAGRAYILPGQTPVIPPIYPTQQSANVTGNTASQIQAAVTQIQQATAAQMPGPGFFSSPEKSTSAATVIQPTIPITGSPSLVSGRPVVNIQPTGMAGTSPMSASTLAAMLSTSALASQAQGAALYSMKTATSSPGATKYQIHMPVAVTSSMPAVATSSISSNTTVTTSVPSSTFSFAFKANPPATPTSKTSAPTTPLSKGTPAWGEVAADEDTEHNQSTGNDSYQEPHFEPLVTLPEVDVVTGEEGEVILVEGRAKLYRYIDQQWKERGLGQIKILHNPGMNKVRVVMRREQILKICANHYILPDTEISFREGKEKNTLTWRAVDYTDEEPRLEQFCCRFKTEDLAQQFKDNFEKGREIAKKAEIDATDKPTVVVSAPEKDKQTKEDVKQKGNESKEEQQQEKGFGDKFKPQEGGWTCTGCYCHNAADVIQCPACETAKPGHEKEVEEKQAEKLSSSSSTSALAKFGAAGTGSSGGGFGNTGSIFGGAAASNSGGFGLNPSGGFTFGSAASFGGMGSKTGSASSISSIGSLTFGHRVTADANANVPTTTAPVKFTFGGAPIAKTTLAEGSSTTATTTTSSTSTPLLNNLVSSVPKPDINKSSTSQPSFGGFTFTKPPVVKEDKEATDKEQKDDTSKKSEVKLNPFASFAFGSGTTVVGTKDEAKTTSAPVFGSHATSETATFSSLAGGSNSCALTKSSDFKGFSGAGKQVFGGATPAKSPEKAGKDEADGTEEEYEPDVDFKPVVELPEVVDLKTGEEDEITLFCERSKLYRFDLSVKQWKERGIGEIKLLKNKNCNKYRCVMRREQVLKLCANHSLNKDMNLTPLDGSEKTYRWMANDFAEEELKQEMFAAKFKTQEIADRFRDEFVNCVKALNEAPIPTLVSEQTCSLVESHRSTPDIVSSSQSLTEMFKLKSDEWECPSCYLKHKNDVIQCSACLAAQPGCEDQVPTTTTTSPASSSFKFGSVNVTTPNKGFTFGAPASTSNSPQNQQTGTTSITGTPVFGGFGGGAKATSSGPSSFTFGAQPNTTSQAEGKSFAFGTNAFSFSGITPIKSSDKAKTPVKSPLKSPLKSPGGGDEYYVDDDGEHIHFEPIVQLPDDYEHKTGEEDEETLYSHRAKLYRFMENQWKERGLGDIKILKHAQTGHIRLLMRREQVLKICLNHRLLASLELKPMANAQGKAWIWHADDYTEGEITHEQFAIRFKTEDIANEFKSVFDDAKQGKEVTPMKVTDKSSVSEKTKDEQKSEKDKDDALSPQISGIKPRTLLDSFNFDTKPAATTSSSSTAFKFGEAKFSFGGTDFGTASGNASGFSFPKSTNEVSSSSMVTSTVTSSKPVGSADSSSVRSKNSLLANLLSSEATDDVEKVPDTTTDNNDDVIFVSEKLPTPDQERRSKQYMLPKSFYFYEDADFPVCPGCVGCDSENFDFEQIGKSNAEDNDVIFLYEETTSPSKQHLVDKYQLPANFYNYEHKEGCTGCPGCQETSQDNEEALIQAAVACMTGDKGNVHYGKQLDSTLSPEEEIIQAAQAFVTGDRGILAHQDRKDNIFASTAAVAGDKGNPYYAKELQEADSTTGGQPKSKEGNSVFGGFSQSGGFDFASLAQQSPNSGLVFGKKKEETGPFQWQGAGASVFSPSKQTGDHEDEDGVEQGPDVHFEPIVSLPEVEVKTGEEDEEVIYNQRSKLYRFDNNQWKERGLGEMKILKHKVTLKYRLLMRREQVFKTCCNHSITTSMVLTQMQTSENAWCWNAMDYTDTEGKYEQFALRFKNKTLAEEFYEKFIMCQKDLELNQQSPSQGDTSVTSSSDQMSDTKQDLNGNQPDSTTGGQDDDDEYEDDDDREVIFSKRVTMNYLDDNGQALTQGTGELQVCLDDDVYGYRIRMENDDAEMVCNHIICRKHVMQKSEKKKFAEWTAKDFSTDEPVKRTFKVFFSSSNAVKEFVGIFRQGVQMAAESVIDEVSDSASITGELLVPPVAEGADAH